MNLDKFKVILCPTLDSAQGLNPDATVEAEYGDICVEGTQVTLAHHGSRSANPAPCNTEVEPLESGTILVSHLDLDTIGGIMALTGDKMEDKEFWEAAEFIDVNGSHHIHELPKEIQEQLNAVYAWNASQARVRYTEVTDVTQQVVDNYTMLSAVLDEAHPQHDSMIQKGKDWERDVTQAVQDKLVRETSNMRIFKTDGVFCSGSYYSPEQDKVLPATVVFNEKFKSITIAFEDGGKNVSARDIVQKLWGPEAGGRDGIAGSPRGREMTELDFQKAQHEVETTIELNEKNKKAFDAMVSLYENNSSVKFLMNFGLGGELKLTNDIKTNNFNSDANYSTLLVSLKYRFEAMDYSSRYVDSQPFDLYREAETAINEMVKNMKLENYIQSLGRNEIEDTENKMCYDALLNAKKRMQFNGDYTYSLLSTMKIDSISTLKEYDPNINYAIALNEAYWKFLGGLNVDNEQLAKEDTWDNAYVIYASLKDYNVMDVVLGSYDYDVFEEEYKEEIETETKNAQEQQEFDDEQIQ